MSPRVGEWWTMDKRGEGVAHLVGIVIPNLLIDPKFPLTNYDHSSWTPLCSSGDRRTDHAGHLMPRTESASLFSTFVRSAEHPRCSTCEVMSTALHRWMEQEGMTF
ncbi:hypothetical protein UG54_01530 [Gordonia sihwensis]|nr:hypothetical protein UG54_01530 [Gordonia sihwensis]